MANHCPQRSIAAPPRAKNGVRPFDGREFSACRAGVHLRLVAYTPSCVPVPAGHLRVIVQVVVAGQPVAEDPLHIELMPAEDFDNALEISKAEGWEIRPWPAPVEVEAAPSHTKPHHRRHAA